MSVFFPHINIAALTDMAVNAAITRDYDIARSPSGTYNPKSFKKIRPIVSNIEDIIWGGEKMIQISFEPESVAHGPVTILAHFPCTRPQHTALTYIGMTSAACACGIDQPKIIGFRYTSRNFVGAEVILFEKPPGESLDVLWPRLSDKKREIICTKVADIMLRMFDMRADTISTSKLSIDGQDLFGHANVDIDNSLLLARPFDDGPLRSMEPQKACGKTAEYLSALARRVDRVFPDHSSSTAAEAPQTGWPGKEQLTNRDIELIRGTWRRLAQLIPFHTGGWYLPESLSSTARKQAHAILQSSEFGLHHTDLQMGRIIVHFPSGPAAEPTLLITGWEHARFAPLWSCARMPPWAHPQGMPLAHRAVYTAMRHAGATEWIVAYVFGMTERFFEGCAGAHWMCRDAVELGILQIREEWARLRPDARFPLPADRFFERMLEADGPRPLTLDEHMAAFRALEALDAEVDSAASYEPDADSSGSTLAGSSSSFHWDSTARASAEDLVDKPDDNNLQSSDTTDDKTNHSSAPDKALRAVKALPKRSRAK